MNKNAAGPASGKKNGRLLGPESSQEIAAALLAWYDLHKRDLPWRRTRDPYAIWVSEIMLQQTRVAAVLGHYARWTQRFPTVRDLAEAKEDQVLAEWSGLGYYRRARFLHRGAQAVVEEHGGEIPKTAETLRQLPGIGEYTSAAIASIAFGEPIAVVDGNVERVVARLKGPSKSAASTNASIKNLAGQILDSRRPGDFNQAMMELGATICLPRIRSACIVLCRSSAAHAESTPPGRDLLRSAPMWTSP